MISAAIALLLTQAAPPALPAFPAPWVEFSSDMSRDTFGKIRSGSWLYCLGRSQKQDPERCMLTQDSNMASIARSLRSLRSWRPASDYEWVIDRCWTVYSDNPEPDARVYESCLAGHAEAVEIRKMIRTAIKN